MKSLKINFLVFALLLSSFAFADNGGGDVTQEISDDMIVLSSETTQATKETHDANVVLTVVDSNGKEEVAVIELEDKNTHEKTWVAVGDNQDTRTLRLLIALRLKFPEIFGARIGLDFGKIEVGVDGGIGIFFNGISYYAHFYPMNEKHKIKSLAENFYIGARYTNETIWAIFGTVKMQRLEGLLGYRFDKEAGGVYGFIEAGVSAQVSPAYGEAFGYHSVTPCCDKKTGILPTLALGIGYAF
jgi:hypothetical protein